MVDAEASMLRPRYLDAVASTPRRCGLDASTLMEHGVKLEGSTPNLDATLTPNLDAGLDSSTPRLSSDHISHGRSIWRAAKRSLQGVWGTPRLYSMLASHLDPHEESLRGAPLYHRCPSHSG